jgi:hypothetical protein
MPGSAIGPLLQELIVKLDKSIQEHNSLFPPSVD